MDTIFAVATAPVKSGVAVIRISGENAGDVLRLLARKASPQPRQAYLSKIYNPETNELIDEALVLWFKSPSSFTGEDIVELHVHGGRAIVAEVLECLGRINNLRAADPGEFSRRAFLNGKMDLTEAEGLADLIDAETKMQARLALRQKHGELGRFYEEWREDILLILANIEAYIDFPDEEIPADIIEKIENKIKLLIGSIARHLNDNKRGERLRSGLHVAIIGPPNVGKSSLLNFLARRDVAIVSAHAGTTRDIIEVHLDLGGYPIIVADTAGIRENAGEIESEGIKRAFAWAAEADLKIIVFDAQCLQEQKSNETFSQIIDKNTIIIVNKIDLLQKKAALAQINGVIPIPASFRGGEGVDEILVAIKNFAENNFDLSGEPVITRERHRILLKDTLMSLESFSLSKEIELASEDLRYAAGAIGKITGKINIEEILDRIFSSFCIGK